jgi:hypothetical protein
VTPVAVLIVIGSVLLSVLVAAASHGHVLFLALPLVFGLPLAGLFRRRR